MTYTDGIRKGFKNGFLLVYEYDAYTSEKMKKYALKIDYDFPLALGWYKWFGVVKDDSDVEATTDGATDGATNASMHGTTNASTDDATDTSQGSIDIAPNPYQ